MRVPQAQQRCRMAAPFLYVSQVKPSFPPCRCVFRDDRMGQLEQAEYTLQVTGQRTTIKPPGGKVQVDCIDWLKGEVARLERAVMESRERALVLNSTPSFFVLFR